MSYDFDCTVGRGRDFDLRSDGLRVYLEDERSQPDAGDAVLHQVRVRVGAPYGSGEYVRTFVLGAGQAEVLDVRHLNTAKVEILAVDGCTDGRQLIVEHVEAPPAFRRPAIDVVTYSGVVPVGSGSPYYTPPQGARTWRAGTPSGGGIAPVPALWHLGGGAELAAGGSSGDVLGPVFSFNAAGDAVLVWEIDL